jgi:hypothetical protein
MRTVDRRHPGLVGRGQPPNRNRARRSPMRRRPGAVGAATPASSRRAPTIDRERYNVAAGAGQGQRPRSTGHDADPFGQHPTQAGQAPAAKPAAPFVTAPLPPATDRGRQTCNDNDQGRTGQRQKRALDQGWLWSRRVRRTLGPATAPRARRVVGGGWVRTASTGDARGRSSEATVRHRPGRLWSAGRRR